MDELLGRTVAHYRILEEVACGGMGVVYRAEDTRLKRQVALKFLPALRVSDPLARNRFLQEAQAASALDHPNICSIHSIEETEDGRTFIVMAYYEGDTIDKKIESGPLPIVEALDIAIQAVQGLTRAHDRGIVHRDVKPANLILTVDGLTKVLDFGVAKLASDARRAGSAEAPWASDASSAEADTRTGALLGTVFYMSPEQARREPTDHRTDIWSLGVTLYEMATGRVPFNGDSANQVIEAILRAEPAALTAARPDAPRELERIVGKAMAKNPAERYQHLDNMLVDLRLLRRRIASDGAASKTSVAVMPFANLSADPEQEYFCDGITEEIINALTRVDGLHVVARTSAFAFKGKNVDVREVGRRLDVRTVLEGSVRRAGNALRIVAQLIDVRDGYQIWSERYDREIEDVFAVQDEIARAIVGSQAVELMGRQVAPQVSRHPRDVEAYTLYLKGRFHWNKRIEEELETGIGFFERAIVKDPTYALAYAGLADSYNILGYYSARSPESTFPRAKANAVKALELDDNLAEAHTSLAFATLLYDWDWSSAERGFQRALALNPDYPTAYHWYAEYLAFMGRLDEAETVTRRVLELDPLSLIINTLLGWVHYYARDYDRAIQVLREVLELEPGFVPARLWLGMAHDQKGQCREAAAILAKAIQLSGDSPLMVSALARAVASCGMKDQARKGLAQLETECETCYVPPYHIAGIYEAIGEHDRAFEWLGRAFGQRDLWLVFLKVDPQWDRLRRDPRFDALIRKVGLPS